MRTLQLARGLGLLLAVAAAAATDPAPETGPPAESRWLAEGTRAVNLLPSGALALYPHDLDAGSSDVECTAAQVFYANFSAFSLPQGTPAASLLLSARVSCGEEGRAGPRLQPGVLFAAGRLQASVDCARGLLLLDGGAGLGSVRYLLPEAQLLGLGLLALAGAAAGGDLRLDIVLTRGGRDRPAGVCVNGRWAQPAGLLLPGTPPLLDYLAGASDIFSAGVSFGAASGSRQRSARANVSYAWATDAALPCGGASSSDDLAQELERAAAGNSAPVLAPFGQQPPGDVFVGDSVRVTASASDSDGDAVRLTLTFFGLAPAGCGAAECGDRQEAATGAAGGSATLTATAGYPRPGRYVIRAQATDGRGAVVTRDHAVLVRRTGDVRRRAECCRHSAMVTAGQLGRPVHETRYRDDSVYRHGEALGWPRQYLDNDDLEAERLFDFGVLAPPVAPTPLSLVSCHGSRLAGAGSPEIRGLSDPDSHATTHGHNKRLALVPEGFNWVASPSQASCQRHWSGWERDSPHTLPGDGAGGGGGGVCSTACTKAGTELLMRETAMFAQYNEALIQASYGHLSLSPNVTVLPEIMLPRDAPPSPAGDKPNDFEYYEAPAQAALAAQAVPHWTYIVLAPQATHRKPDFRAWTTQGAGGSVITQCTAQLYYAVHETGHRMGFRHANMLRLADARAAPADPLGPGVITTDGYTASLDVMACCKSDFGLHDRTMAGWVRPEERAVVTAAELAAPGTRRLQLWPFDRSESRGNLMALSLRRSDGELLLLGFRSAPHWQDVRVAPDGSSGPLAPEESRHNVAGLSVEYVRREGGAWGGRGLLDFNVLKGDWPDALPAGTNQFPRTSQYALLREGQSWYDNATRALVSVEGIVPCATGTPGLPLYNHSAPNFMGYRGEPPAGEFYERADYSGYSGLECLQLAITTAAAPPLTKLPISLELSHNASGSGSGGPAACGVPLQPAVVLRLPEGVAISAIMWRDNLNRTLPALRGAAAVTLPPLRPVAESASDPSFGCQGRLCPGETYSVQVLAADGRHSRAEITALSLSLRGVEAAVRYKYYLQHSLEQGAEELSLEYDLGGGTTVAGGAPGFDSRWGVALHAGLPALPLRGAGAGLTAHAPVDASCSRQWTLSALLLLNQPLARQEGVVWSADGGYPALAIGRGKATWRAVWLQWGPYVRKLDIADSKLQQLHIVVARDAGRLGLFVNGQGGWLMPDLACIPTRDAITYYIPGEAVLFDSSDYYRLRAGGSALLVQGGGHGSGAVAVIVASAVAGAVTVAGLVVALLAMLRRRRRVTSAAAAAEAADKQAPTPKSDCSDISEGMP